MKDLVVVGSGGINIVRLIEEINAEKKIYNFLGFLEKDKTKHGNVILGYPVLGSDDLLIDKLKNCVVINNVMANPRIHEIVTKNLINAYHIKEFPNLVHPSVNLSHSTIGVGNIIYPHTVIEPMACIGDFNILFNAYVAHETVVGDYNLMASSFVGSRTTIGSYNMFGNRCSVHNLCKVGDDNVIGVGSVVMKSIGSGKHLLGNPAMEMGEFIHYFMRKKK